MTKKFETKPIARKHGARARGLISARSMTLLTFERGSQAYVWLTDRKRAKLARSF